MPESAIDNQLLLRRTLVTAGTMLGGCVLIVGMLTLIALAIVGHAVAPAQETAADGGAAPALTAGGKAGAPLAVPTKTKTK
jgi:hypothetical protein